ncbi:GAF domain-containing protein [Adhaeribacter aquaticus]|uniref:GAF domain-containing protein n=1 Tax=Adhaeribacter aquaticus TaxID=299567 RepID=UPI0008FF03D5|nr:GAF domain-containing protein [Adhaeribacter aquaticus]
MITETREEERIKVLRRYDILDTPPDGSLDRLTALAAKLFNVPIAIISMVDTDRIWFKSHHGLEVEQVDRDPGLCDSAILSNEVYIVEDAKEDLRTLANPLAAEGFGLRFYAGAPLQTRDGYNLGTFCLIDKKQRYLTENQREILREFAAVAMDEIEIRLSARQNTKKVNLLLQETAQHLKASVYKLEDMAGTLGNDQLHSLAEETKSLLQKIEQQVVK